MRVFVVGLNARRIAGFADKGRSTHFRAREESDTTRKRVA